MVRDIELKLEDREVSHTLAKEREVNRRREVCEWEGLLFAVFFLYCIIMTSVFFLYCIIMTLLHHDGEYVKKQT